MIVPDINLLLYAYFSPYAEHESARRWWELATQEGETIGLAPPVIFGFVRLATNRRIFVEPKSVEDSLCLVEEWLKLPRVVILRPGARHVRIAFDLLRAAGVSRDLTTDVQIATYALENNAVIHTADTDFGRFPGVRFVNPLGPQ
jgi:toxin-antitoxin system PIN domain toxin